MMINSCIDIQQDTVPVKSVVLQDSVRLNSDSASIIKPIQSHDSIPRKLTSAPATTAFDFTDTTTVCDRNSISDITFYDSNNVVTNIESGFPNRFPFIFTEKNNQMQREARASLIKHLKPGQDLPVHPFHDDWVILIIVVATFFYLVIRTTSKSLLPGVTRFFMFRGINDTSSREGGGIFHWQSTILNLNSFLIIGLFLYYAATYYDFIPSGIKGIVFWLISLGIIISVVTLRHIVCIITGNASGQTEAFREYLLGVYQSYRFSALFLFIIIILMSYTLLFPTKAYFISGIIVLGIMYLIRILRLLIIFINRNISIFYLILYLCALEILPVLISFRYFTGRV